MEIKNFRDYNSKLMVIKDVLFTQTDSNTANIKNIQDKFISSDLGKLVSSFQLQTVDYLCELIETNNQQTLEKVKKSLVSLCKELSDIHFTTIGCNSFKDITLEGVVVERYLDVKFLDFVKFKVFYYAFFKSMLGLIFNDLIIDKKELINLNFENNFEKYLEQALVSSKDWYLYNTLDISAKNEAYEKNIGDVQCPEWFSPEGFYIFNKFLNRLSNPSQMQMSFIIKKLLKTNHVNQNKGYKDSVYSFWLLENYDLELSKVRSLGESSSDATILIYNTIIDNL